MFPGHSRGLVPGRPFLPRSLVTVVACVLVFAPSSVICAVSTPRVLSFDLDLDLDLDLWFLFLFLPGRMLSCVAAS